MELLDLSPNQFDCFGSEDSKKNYLDYSLSLISPFSESKIAKGLVYSISERMIIITTVKGTLTIIPVVPHINPQNIKDRMLTKGLMFIEFPIHFGSIKLPMIT